MDNWIPVPIVGWWCLLVYKVANCKAANSIEFCERTVTLLHKMLQANPAVSRHCCF